MIIVLRKTKCFKGINQIFINKRSRDDFQSDFYLNDEASSGPHYAKIRHPIGFELKKNKLIPLHTSLELQIFIC